MEEKYSEIFLNLSREKLEEQLIKNLKHIKFLKKQNQEILEENNLFQNQINELKEELNENNNSSFGLSNIGKTFSSIFEQKKNSFLIFKSNSILIEPIYDNNEQIKPLKLEIENLKLKLNLNLKNQEKFETYELKINEFTNTINDLINKNEELKSNLDISKFENQNLKLNISKLENDLKISQNQINKYELQIPDLLSSKTEYFDLNSKYNITLEQLEKLKIETIDLRVKTQDSERQIEQLRDSLKKSMKNDKEKDDKLFQLNSIIKDINLEKIELQQQIEGLKEHISIKDNDINDLNLLIKQLQKRLDLGCASEEMEQKLKKMNKMLEKSNLLYVEMKDKALNFESRVKDLEIQLHNAKSPGIPLIKIQTPFTNFILYDNGIYNEKNDISNIKTIIINDQRKLDQFTQTIKEENSLTDSNLYIINLMKQFFIVNDQSKKDLSIVLMRALKFSEQDINDILNKKKGFKSFF